MCGEAKGAALREMLIDNGIREFTMGTGENTVKIKLAGGRTKKAA